MTPENSYGTFFGNKEFKEHGLEHCSDSCAIMKNAFAATFLLIGTILSASASPPPTRGRRSVPFLNCPFELCVLRASTLYTMR